MLPEIKTEKIKKRKPDCSSRARKIREAPRIGKEETICLPSFHRIQGYRKQDYRSVSAGGLSDVGTDPI